MQNPTEHDPEPKLPPVWILAFLIAWATCGLAPLILTLIGKHWFSLANSDDAAIAGTIGDAFGMVNSFFSGAALLFVIWSIRLQQHEIRFARKEWEANTKSQEVQADMMRHTANLTSINHIYAHYSDDYGRQDTTGILRAIASGHRRWAVRESFDSVDGLFRDDRVSQVQREADQLAELLMVPAPDTTSLSEIAWRLSSLLVEKRIHPIFRKSLWRVYELIRDDPEELFRPSSPLFSAFTDACAEAVSAWKISRS